MASPALPAMEMDCELKKLLLPVFVPSLLLMEAPEMVGRAHGDFITAGAEVITTNSYALVPFHIGRARFDSEGLRLAEWGAHARELAAHAAVEQDRVRCHGRKPPLSRKVA